MEDFITEDMKLAVKRGAHWLDENHSGWETRLDLDNLRMSSCHKCVIGQAVGDYYGTITSVTGSALYTVADNDWAVEYGFSTPVGTEYKEWLKLEFLWTEQVEQRLGRG